MSNKFTSFLQKVGQDFKKGLDYVLPFAKAATVGVSVINPTLGSALAATIGVVSQTEQKFAAMGTQNGTGAQKLAETTTILEPALTQIFANSGVTLDTSHVQAYINGVVAMLNAIPAPAETATKSA